MKVWELIEELSRLDPEAVVVVQECAEFNYYCNFPSVHSGYYLESRAEFHGMEKGEDDKFEPGTDGVPAVAIQ